MKIINAIMTRLMKKRIHRIESFMKYPHETQQKVFQYLTSTAKDTVFGKQYGFRDLSFRAFQQRVPVTTYENLYPYIDRLMRGEQHVLWPSPVYWFAKSSGTTQAQSKFIPVSREALRDCHYRGGRDMLTLYVHNHPETRLFSGKNVALGGGYQRNPADSSGRSYKGNISGIIIKNLPSWAQYARTPHLEVALMDDWEDKVDVMTRMIADQRITSLAGGPTWVMLLLQRVMALKNASHIREVWPHLEVFFHGQVSFAPYRLSFQKLIPAGDMHYLETYNASEGFFGLQDLSDVPEMLLLLDHGVYYEFVAAEDQSDHPKVYNLSEVEPGRNYAIVISTNAGLWRYKIGDTIKFTSLRPYRFVITGRTKHFINAFGEKLIVEDADQGITAACHQTHALVENFTVAPRYSGHQNKGCHEWVIEFIRPPDDLSRFVDVLDETLRQANTSYGDRRIRDVALEKPIIHSVAPGTFYRWLKKHDKLGGQHKVPRLSNSREFIEDILSVVHENGHMGRVGS